jgi:hypothetical protein
VGDKAQSAQARINNSFKIIEAFGTFLFLFFMFLKSNFKNKFGSNRSLVNQIFNY